MQCVMTNLTGVEGPAAAQQAGLEFNSMVNFNGMHFGASDLGVHEIFCGQSDAGEDIDAYFIIATVDLGEMYKRIRYVYLGLEGDGNLLLTVTTDNATIREYPIELDGTPQQRVRVKLDRNVKGRYWVFKISNTQGCDFSIDDIQISHF